MTAYSYTMRINLNDLRSFLSLHIQCLKLGRKGGNANNGNSNWWCLNFTVYLLRPCSCTDWKNILAVIYNFMKILDHENGEDLFTYHNICNWAFFYGDYVTISFPGSKCPSDGMTAHIVCSPGEYQNSTGQTDCIDCPAGYECSDPTSLPVECGPGLYAPAQSTNCTQCPTGQSYISNVVHQYVFVCFVIHLVQCLLLYWQYKDSLPVSVWCPSCTHH